MRASDQTMPGGKRRQRRARLIVRALTLLTAFAALISGVVVAASPAEAVPRGETVTFPGGVTISNFVLPGGKRAYCIEVVMGEPTGAAWFVGRTGELPGRPGLLHAWGNPHGMRQMNYLIDRHGQTGDALTSAAVQLTVWRMRENFLSANPMLNRKIAILKSSPQGRALIAQSDWLYADARANAKAPKPAPKVSGKLSIAPDPSGRVGRFRVAYPQGTVSLSVTGGKFVRNGASSLAVSAASASARYVDVRPGATEIKVAGTWKTQGSAGWDSVLDVYNTTTSSGSTGQRIAVATGKSTVPKRQGNFAAVTAAPPPPAAPPVASSQAQPSAEVGGTMKDEVRVRAQGGTTLQMWPNATASFTAYLAPEVGTPKYTPEWEPVLGEPYEAQMEDEMTGEPLWRTWWANAQGEPLRDADGNQIPAAGDDGVPTSGTAADGTVFPVPQLDESGAPVLGGDGTPQFHLIKEPVLEQRRDPVRWSEAELSAMTEGERCLVQPIFHEAGLPIPRPGDYASSATTVRSGGTVHWVERVKSNGKFVHEGKCGLPNETTRINQPGVVTQAPAELVIGETAYDTATVSGTLLPSVDYTIQFEAYRAPDSSLEAAAEPTCTAENRVFRSERLSVTAAGQIRSPGFTLGPDHGTMLWWIETLEYDDGSGSRVLHRGACGLENETTRLDQPTVETQAMPDATIGDLITDTAVLGGNFATNDGAQWELDFRGYRASLREDGAAVCDASNLLFEVPVVAVSGPGSVTSAPVPARPEWRGDIWWVETLWLTQGDVRTAYAVGECGLVGETTRLEGPSVETKAVPLAAIGDAMTDTATVTGPLGGREGVSHELTFEVFQGDDALTGTEDATCTADNLIWTSEATAVTEAGDYESPPLTALPAHGKTVWWVESLWLVDGTGTEPERTLIERGTCGVDHETTRLQWPEVATVATPKVRVGEELFDTAIVEGALSQREDIEYKVRFTAYERPNSGEMSCAADTEIAALSDREGVSVRGPGRYESRKIVAQPEHVGLGGYVESLVLIADGQEHLVHRGECGVASENFEIVPTERATPREGPSLPRTGGAGIPPAVVGGAALVGLAGAGVLGLAWLRRRGKNL